MGTESRRRLFRRSLALLVACTLALIGAELVLRYTSLGERIYYNAPIYVGERETLPNKLLVPEPELGWLMQPETSVEYPTEGRQIEYRADARGFRTGSDTEVVEQPNQIVIVGDSFAWGFGVHWDETFAAQLDSKLAESSVDLMAMPGFGLDQIAQSVRHSALPTKPELVVVAIFSDDLSRCFTAYRETEYINKPLFRLDGDVLVRSTEADQPSSAQLLIERELKLYALYWHLRRALGKRQGVGSWWALNAAFLDLILDDSQAAGVPVLFIHIPKRTGVALPALAEHLRERGAALIDLADDSHEPLADLYFKEDGHFSPHGHRYMAELVHDWIRRNLPELK